jgi:hypothetical protein
MKIYTLFFRDPLLLILSGVAAAALIILNNLHTILSNADRSLNVGDETTYGSLGQLSRDLLDGMNALPYIGSISVSVLFMLAGIVLYMGTIAVSNIFIAAENDIHMTHEVYDKRVRKYLILHHLSKVLVAAIYIAFAIISIKLLIPAERLIADDYFVAGMTPQALPNLFLGFLALSYNFFILVFGGKLTYLYAKTV